MKAFAVTRARTRPTDSLSAYDLVLRARAIANGYGDFQEAEALLVRAIALDPQYALAQALMGHVLNVQSMFDGNMERRERAAEFARTAQRLDPDEPWSHSTLAFCLTFLRRLPEAGGHFERALLLNPNDVFIGMLHAMWCLYVGQVEQAVNRMQECLKRDPFAHDWFWDVYCMTLVVADRHGEALAAFEKMIAPASWTFVYAAIAHVNLGNMDAAR